ncbi:bleomycin resistance protein [Streptomyces gobiensis]|uniref:bleomycin resistance protein n=1 Tax=Streptomyces gobiensis TaxID=2875706 RepID=UPI001E52E355|nr:VOC family protein [Streptomyces gobiensis]UGY92240.1 VOC family protein [Streptomyces gobiensis]
MTEKVAPGLSCPSLSEQLDFYRALGFEVTYEQHRPYSFGAVEYGDGIELHFVVDDSVVPEESWGGCYITTDRVDELYAAFRAGLKQAFGKIPTHGIPRIGQLKDTSYGVRQFLLTDPGGNSVRVGQPNGEPLEHGPAPKEKFAKAVHYGWLLGESKGDPAQGARILDRALAEETPASQAEYVLALILRADLAAQLKDTETARRLLAEAEPVEAELSEAERASVADELERAADLRAALGGD